MPLTRAQTRAEARALCVRVERRVMRLHRGLPWIAFSR
jgi:hypothetical protein